MVGGYMDKAQRRVQEIGRATLGYRIYLNKCPAGYYWSDYDEKNEKDETGGLFHATPLDALKSILEASDFLIDPATGEFMLMVVR
jgi:hypothetical protein